MLVCHYPSPARRPNTRFSLQAYFAIKAGARKVYAIEASSVADRAAQLMAANGLSDRIVVLKQTVETAELPEKVSASCVVTGARGHYSRDRSRDSQRLTVQPACCDPAVDMYAVQADIIISEPMGFMLIHERMLESYIIARKRFLKPGGLMFPTTGTIFTAPFTDATLWTEQASKVAFWHNSDFFGLDLTSLADAASKDHFSQPVVGYIDPSSLMAGTTVDHTIDFANDAPESLQTITIPFEFTANRTGVCHGLAAWFDVAFNGSTERVVLNTGPYYPGTHWYQCRLLLREPIAVNAGQRLSGQLLCVGNERYSYNLTLSMKLVGSEATTGDGSPIASSVALNLHDQMYHYLNNASYGQTVAGTTATS